MNILFSIGVYALIIGLLAFLGYFFLKAFKADDAMKTSWTDLSQRLGFDLSYPRLGLPEIEGDLEERRIRIRATPGSGGSDGGPEKTHYYAEHKRSTMSRLKLEHSGQLSFQSDIKIGVAAFDERFKLMCKQPDLAQQLFADEGLVEEIMQLRAPELLIDKEKLILSEVGIHKEAKVMQKRLVFVTALAERLEAL